jgi:hypothetical protein
MLIFTLMMEATRRHIPEDCIVYSADRLEHKVLGPGSGYKIPLSTFIALKQKVRTCRRFKHGIVSVLDIMSLLGALRFRDHVILGVGAALCVKVKSSA